MGSIRALQRATFTPLAWLLVACGAAPLDARPADAGGDGGSICERQASLVGDVSNPREVDFVQPGTMGIFDPSVASAPDSSRLWMTYSSAVPAADATISASIISNRVAYTDDGLTWHDSGVAFAGLETTYGAMPAVWQYETSGLVYDSTDASPASRWKVFTFRYLVRNQVRDWSHSWLSVSSAPDPVGPWSEETKVLTGFLYDAADDAIAGPAPKGSALDPSLADCGTFDEPSAIVKGDVLYLALTCETKLPESSRVVLLHFTSGKWTFVATVLSHPDAQALGAPKLTGSSFFSANGNVYLIESPQDGPSYRGCVVYEMEDLTKGTLKSCGSQSALFGKVNPLASATPPQTMHRGACTYDPKLGAAGLMYFDGLAYAGPGTRVARTFTAGLPLLLE